MEWLQDKNVKAIGIFGLGGIGKSSLAVRIYNSEISIPKENRFWVEVTVKPDFAAFAKGIIAGLGGKPTSAGKIEELVNELVAFLSKQQYFLVVDNLETLLDEKRRWLDEGYGDFFREWFQRGSNSIILVTSREKPILFDGKKANNFCLELGGIGVENGVELLEKEGIYGEKKDLQEFCEEVNSHPLCLKLVASFLREYCDCDFNEIKELQQEELVYEEAYGLHRNRENACLSWSLNQHLENLDTVSKRFLEFLCVYRLPFDSEAAGVMFGKIGDNLDKIKLKKALGGLVNRSLLMKLDGGSFEFLSLVRNFVISKSEDLRNAHELAIDYYRKYYPFTSDKAITDVDGYLELFYHHCQLEGYDSAFDVIEYCYSFLSLRGYYTKIVESYEILLKVWEEKDFKDFNAISRYVFTVNSLGNAYEFFGEYYKAIKFHQHNLEINAIIDNNQWEASSLNNLGNAYKFLGKYNNAIQSYQKSLEISREIGNRKGEASFLNNLGNAYKSLGKYNNAIDYIEESLEINREIGNQKGEAKALGNLGNIFQRLGKHSEAINYQQESLKINREIGNREGEVSSLNNLGNAYKSQGKYENAIESYQKSLEISREIKYFQGEINSLNNLGDIFQCLGKYNKAIDYYQASLEINRRIEYRQGEANSLYNLGNTYHCLGEYQNAIESYQESLKIKRKLENSKELTDVLGNLGVVYTCLKEYQKAIESYQESLEISRRICYCQGEVNSLIGLGVNYNFLGKDKEAIESYQESLEISRRIGYHQGESISLYNLGYLYYWLQEYQKAMKYYLEAFDISIEIGDYFKVGICCFYLGDIFIKLNQNTEAKKYYLQARDLFKAMGLYKDVEKCNQKIEELN